MGQQSSTSVNSGQQLSKTGPRQRKKTARFPTSEPAKRIAAIFHRQLTTSWSEKEIKQFRSLVKDGCFESMDGLAIVERCYKKQWPPNRDKNILRHDLITFLNNYRGELDKATAWNEAHPIKQGPRKIIPMPEAVSSQPALPVDPVAMEHFLSEFKTKHGRLPYGYEEKQA